MMTREEVAEIITYCKEKGISYKSRLEDLGIPARKSFDNKSPYAKEQSESPVSNGEFLQLTSDGVFVPMPSFAATTGRGFSKKKSQQIVRIALKCTTCSGIKCTTLGGDATK